MKRYVKCYLGFREKDEMSGRCSGPSDPCAEGREVLENATHDDGEEKHSVAAPIIIAPEVRFPFQSTKLLDDDF